MLRRSAAALALLSLLTACGSQSAAPQAAAPVRTVEASEGTTITIDGDNSDWPGTAAITYDESYLYFRFSVEGPERSLQASPESLVLYLDADANPATGVQPNAPDVARSLGADLELHFSPRAAVEAGRNGVALFVNTPTGRQRVSHAEFDFVSAPTFAADWYEFRLARVPLSLTVGGGGFPELGMASRGAVRGMFTLFDETGEIDGWSDPFDLSLGSRAQTPDYSQAAAPPAKGDAIRVISHNVLRGKPVREPTTFAEIYNALQPDVLLLQEWDDVEADALVAWFRALVPSETSWHALVSGGRGVGLVSRYPIDTILDADIDDPDSEYPIRIVAGIVRTPQGPLLAATTHLKCCGGAGSREDDRRSRQATVLNEALRDAVAAWESENEQTVAMRAIGGDLNLVGTRRPMDLFRKDLDVDGDDLIPARTDVPGTSALYTWTAADSSFPPGRLDFILVGDAAATTRAAFALDTARLSEQALSELGLYRDDARVSDHLPLVVDLKPID